MHITGQRTWINSDSKKMFCLKRLLFTLLSVARHEDSSTYCIFHLCSGCIFDEKVLMEL